MPKEKKAFPVNKSASEWKNQLTKEEYKILRKGGTERYGCGSYNNQYPKSGYFACKGCDHPLYSVTSKFPDSGWVAFDQCYHSKAKCHVGVQRDFGGLEVICNGCGGHLGHVFYGEKHTDNNERH
ncbi:hypothetical protein AAMO2058_001431800 [Amorphochlora amoebiformis]|uniref:MsrB domain-containing protein n=1 Tax=Amorphochlora amoebiformis TaxID=1561963 RepID=A0A7S0H3D4_9EUKA